MGRRNIANDLVNNIQEQLKSVTSSRSTFLNNLPAFKDGEERVIRIVPHIEFAKFIADNMENDKVYDGGSLPFKTVWVHGSKDFVIPCPKKLNPSNRCAFCENAEKYKDDSDSDVAKAAKRNFPSMKLLTYVIWRNGSETENTVYKWLISATTGKSLIGIYSNSDYADGIEDPFEGVDLTITREGTRLDTTYDIIPRRKSSYLFTSEYMKNGKSVTEFDVETFTKFVETLPNIDGDFTTEFTYDETKALLLGEASFKDVLKAHFEDAADSNGADEEPEKPSRSRREVRTVSDDDDEDEDRTPIRRTRRS